VVPVVEKAETTKWFLLDSNQRSPNYQFGAFNQLSQGTLKAQDGIRTRIILLTKQAFSQLNFSGNDHLSGKSGI
jgi:hypothetical protein